MKDFDKKDILLGVGGILFGVVVILLLHFIVDIIEKTNNVKMYEYNCDHIPITEAWKDDKCRDYFNRTSGDFNE